MSCGSKCYCSSLILLRFAKSPGSHFCGPWDAFMKKGKVESMSVKKNCRKNPEQILSDERLEKWGGQQSREGRVGEGAGSVAEIVSCEQVALQALAYVVRTP